MHEGWKRMTSRAVARTCRTLALLGATLALAACVGGPIKRVSEPGIGIQQLTVQADGRWSIDLRLQNFSSVPMRFGTLTLELEAGGVAAGTLTHAPALTVGPESADVVTVAFTPSAEARIAAAGALADGRQLSYSVRGTINAAAQDRKPRDFPAKRTSALSPVPGLAGVLR